MFSINETAKKIGVSRDTLRYYDKIKLISPQRGANNYRYYTQEDMLFLIYIKVMKYADFTLEEIRAIMVNFNSRTPEECDGQTLLLLGKKKKQITAKVKRLNDIIELLNVASLAFSQKQDPNDHKMNDLVLDIYESISLDEV